MPNPPRRFRKTWPHCRRAGSPLPGRQLCRSLLGRGRSLYKPRRALGYPHASNGTGARHPLQLLHKALYGSLPRAHLGDYGKRRQEHDHCPHRRAVPSGRRAGYGGRQHRSGAPGQPGPANTGSMGGPGSEPHPSWSLPTAVPALPWSPTSLPAMPTAIPPWIST